MDETALIKAAKGGDLNAFNRLVLAYQDIAYSLAYRMLGEKPMAQDATQEAFVSAFKNIRSYRRGSFNAWLLRIVTNTCHDLVRYEGRRPHQSLEPLDENGEEVGEAFWLPDDGESLEDAVSRAELAQAIRNCLTDVPESYRAVLVMVDIQGLSYQDAMEVVGIPIGTIKSRLARGRKLLLQCLNTFWELFSDF